ncbi:MAG: hypothetical protein H7X70_06285, partial [Candidatus Kapabacteria bacterium]|nr:hypothetical protein [Candidatus Kapabacteria bacterium]
MRILFLLVFFSVGALAQTSTTQLPVSLLGKHSRVIVSVKDLLQSMAWWTKLGFSPLSRASDKIDSAITLSDGQIVLTLVKTSQPSPVLVYRSENIKNLKAKLDSLTIRTTFDLEGPSYGELRLRS